MFDQLESLRDLLADLKPISKDVYAGALDEESRALLIDQADVDALFALVLPYP